MHVLIASPYLPWPLTDGGKAAQYRMLEALRDCCRFTLVVPVHSLEQERDAKTFAAKFPGMTVEAVRNFSSVPRLFRRSHWRKTGGRLLRSIVHAATSTQSGPPERDDGPHYPFAFLKPAFIEALEAHVARGCDIFQAEFAEMLPLGPLMKGRVPSLFVHHQLHHVYARRHMQTSTTAGAMARYMTERMICEEYAYLSTFDSAIVFSETDRKALNEFCPKLPVDVSPFPAPEEPQAAEVRFRDPVNKLVFVASESHGPNVEGLRWFMKEVWPIIRKSAPEVSFEVIGTWSSSARTALPNHEDISFLGFVPELNPALQGKIMVVPVRIGSGIRTKILAAWTASCPVVTTSVGMEGLPGNHGEHFMVADSATDFASACIGLARDVDALNRLIANALDKVKERYSLDGTRKARMDCYRKLMARHAGTRP